MFMAIDGAVAGLISVADPIMAFTPQAIRDLHGIVRARRLSRSTMRNIRQNLFFAFTYNTLGVPVAAGILYSPLGLLLSLIIAAAAG